MFLFKAELVSSSRLRKQTGSAEFGLSRSNVLVEKVLQTLDGTAIYAYRYTLTPKTIPDRHIWQSYGVFGFGIHGPYPHCFAVETK